MFQTKKQTKFNTSEPVVALVMRNDFNESSTFNSADVVDSWSSPLHKCMNNNDHETQDDTLKIPSAPRMMGSWEDNNSNKNEINNEFQTAYDSVVYQLATERNQTVPLIVEGNSVVIFSDSASTASSTVVRVNMTDQQQFDSTLVNQPHVAQLVLILVNDLGFNMSEVVRIIAIAGCVSVLSFISYVRSRDMGIVLEISQTEQRTADREADIDITALIIKLIGNGYSRNEVLDAVCIDRCKTVADAMAVLNYGGKIQQSWRTNCSNNSNNTSNNNMSQVCLNALSEEVGHLITAYKIDSLTCPLQQSYNMPAAPTQYYIPHPGHIKTMGRTNVLRNLIQCGLDCADSTQLSTRELREILFAYIHDTYVI